MNKWLEKYLDKYGNVTGNVTGVTGNVTGKDAMVDRDKERVQTVEKMWKFKGLEDEFYLVEYLDSFSRPTQDVLLYVGKGEFVGAWWGEDDADDADPAFCVSVLVCDALSIWEIKRGETPDG